MIKEIKLPDLGEGIDGAEVSEVKVSVGDVITADKTILVLESDKASMEIPSEVNGKVNSIFVEVGNEISVNASRISSAITSSLNNLIHAEGEFSSLLSTDYAIETTTFTVSSMIKETSLALLAQANAPKKAVNTLVSNVMENQWDPTFFLVQGGGYRYRNI